MEVGEKDREPVMRKIRKGVARAEALSNSSIIL
ncbi:hypothetical protein PM3016_65 [Paenibacillus mucilaginosus 3016]|uniref:Uncharacterized protein n=1 Tax=Paenibacillus mucilaginosus 3016 TaxID=1116391 RepID=H6NT41_9BACL|nr:hypothetical protein PM3016_65 [Paenibacillus mucilaginosus 3016]